MKKIVVIFITAFLLQGCLEKKNPITDDAIFQKTVPVCDSEELCARMWDMAGEWVKKYSPQGIKEYEDDVIQSAEKGFGFDDLEIEVRKVKIAEGKYKIMIDVLCNPIMSSCKAERKNILAFNQKLSTLLPAETQVKTQEIITDNLLLESWLKQYADALNKSSIDALAPLYHWPATIVENDKISVLQNAADLKQHMTELKSQLQKARSIYINLDSLNVMARTSRTSYINVFLKGYDADNTKVLVRQLGFHLLDVGDSWQVMSMVVAQ